MNHDINKMITNKIKIQKATNLLNKNSLKKINIDTIENKERSYEDNNEYLSKNKVLSQDKKNINIAINDIYSDIQNSNKCCNEAENFSNTMSISHINDNTFDNLINTVEQLNKENTILKNNIKEIEIKTISMFCNLVNDKNIKEKMIISNSSNTKDIIKSIQYNFKYFLDKYIKKLKINNINKYINSVDNFNKSFNNFNCSKELSFTISKTNKDIYKTSKLTTNDISNINYSIEKNSFSINLLPQIENNYIDLDSKLENMYTQSNNLISLANINIKEESEYKDNINLTTDFIIEKLESVNSNDCFNLKRLNANLQNLELLKNMIVDKNESYTPIDSSES